MTPDHNDLLLQRARKGRPTSERWIIVFTLVMMVLVGVGTVMLVRG